MSIDKDDLLKRMAEERNNEAKVIERRIAKESGKIDGMDFMVQRMLDYFRSDNEPEEDGEC